MSGSENDFRAPFINELPDEGEHNAPFNATEVPSMLEAVDAPDQHAVEAAIYDHNDEQGQDHVTLFHAGRVKTLGLDIFRNLWVDGNARGAMRLLSRRHRLDVEPHHRVDIEDPDVSIGAGPHYLDYTMFVGARCGLDAVLPNIAVDHTWRLHLDFSTIQHLWPDSKATRLPFDIKGRMMRVGKRTQEHAWICMVPNEWLIPDHPLNATGAWPRLNAPTSAMTTDHALMLVMFMAHAFSTLRFRDFSCRETYPDPLTRLKVNSVTDIFNRPGEQYRIVDLRLRNVRALHEHLLDEWESWVEHAPEAWKADGFLIDNTPIAISMMYGQNQQILHPDMAAIEAANWKRDRDYAHIKFFRFSIATHINHMEVLEWRDIPVPQLNANYPVAYDSSDDTDEVRHQVDLATLPILDMDGNEIYVYGPDGYRIIRRQIQGFVETGSLLDLSKVHTLFEPLLAHNADDNDNTDEVIKYTLYPLAFTRKYGNLQADGVISPFACKLRQLDAQLREVEEAHSDDDEADVNQPLAGQIAPRLLYPVSCQIYNAISHRVRDAAKFHEVQLGLLTSALAGCTAQTLPTKNRWQRTVDRVREALPHQRFAEKVEGDNQPQSMRFENTYQLDVQRLPAEKRFGDVIFKEVIKPLTRIWAHPSVLRPVKDVCVVLKKDIIPELFQCTAYPLTCLIECLWNTVEPSLKLGHVVDPCTLEMVAMLERTLNYAHTGNARVLTRALMDRAWLGLSILNDGIPCIADSFIPAGSLFSGMISIQKDRWPVHPATRLPLTASQRSQELTYGEGHYASYLAAFTINIAMKHMPYNEYPDHREDDGLRLASYAAEVALRSLVGDITSLVRTAILEELNPIIAEGGPDAAIARKRKRALVAWLELPHPLSIDNDALPLLIEAVVVPLEGVMALKKSTPASMPLAQFISDIIAHCNKDRPRRRPPFIANSHFLHVARAAIREVTTFSHVHLGMKKEDAGRLIEQGFVSACHRPKIHQVPWSAPPPEGQRVGPGAPSRQVVHNVWMNLGARNPKGPSTSVAMLAYARTPAALACQTSARMIAEDPLGDWSVMEVTLKDFHSVLHKMVLPKELLIQGQEEQGGVESYILEAFEYARSSYNPDNPVHLLAIIASIACIGLLPAIFANDTGIRENRPAEQAHFIPYIRTLDWVPKVNKNKGKGVNDRELFMRMLTWYIICLYDSKSPISLRSRDKTVNNAKWFNKYNSKGITGFLLCRLGLAIPNKARAFATPAWGRDVVPLTHAAIMLLRDNVVQRLTGDKKYGGYDAIQHMMGTKTADQLTKSGYITGRISGTGSGQGSGGQKRAEREWEGEEPEVEYVRANASGKVHNRKVSRAF